MVGIHDDNERFATPYVGIQTGSRLPPFQQCNIDLASFEPGDEVRVGGNFRVRGRGVRFLVASQDLRHEEGADIA